MSVEVQAKTIVGRGFDPVGARHRRQQLAAPADAEVVGRHALAGRASPRAIRLSVGEPRSQRKPICASTRTSAGVPDRSRLRKYSPRRPRSLRARSRAQVLRFDQRRRGGIFAPFDQVDAARMHHLHLRRGIADALQDGHRRCRRAVVVAQQRHGVVGGRADHGDAACSLRDSGSTPSFFSSTIDSCAALRDKRVVLRRLVDGCGDPRPAHHLRRVEHAQPHARGEQPGQCGVDLGFGDEALASRPSGKVAILLAASSSVPFFTASAAASSRVATILWFFQMSTIAQQSDTT